MRKEEGRVRKVRKRGREKEKVPVSHKKKKKRIAFLSSIRDDRNNG